MFMLVRILTKFYNDDAFINREYFLNTYEFVTF